MTVERCWRFTFAAPAVAAQRRCGAAAMAAAIFAAICDAVAAVYAAPRQPVRYAV